MPQERTLLSVLVVGGLLQVGLGVVSETVVLTAFGVLTAILGAAWLWASK